MRTISCLCPTYNRAPDHLHLVEEALESFLRQDYPAKEFIILNDAPGQVLRFDHSQVRVVNTPFRCRSLLEKRDLLVSLAHGELLCVWDDDDISLPWRLSCLADRLGDADYYNPRCYWFLDANGLHHDHAMGYAVNASIFRKSAWQAIGAMPSVSLAEDAVADQRLSQQRVATADPLPLDEWFYIYRWGVSPCHLSGSADEKQYHRHGGQSIQTGTFDLTPHWRQDYVALTRQHLGQAA